MRLVVYPLRTGLVLVAAIAACGDGDQQREVESPDPHVIVCGGPDWIDRITVKVIRDEAASTTTPPSDLAAWLLSSSGRKYTFDDEGRAGIAGMKRFASSLAALGDPESRPKRVLVIRADGDAPYAAIQRILEAASNAGFHRIEAADSRKSETRPK